MAIPNKLQSGDVFKANTVRKINQIIDYLHTQRISGDNKTLKVTQNTSGISLQAMPQISAPKGGKPGASVTLGVLITAPSTGAIGTGALKVTQFDENGGHTEQSNSTPTIIPYLGGYYGV